MTYTDTGEPTPNPGWRAGGSDQRVIEAAEGDPQSPRQRHSWEMWWKFDLRHLSDHDINDEIEYCDRELAECLAYEAVVTGHLDPEDYASGLITRQHMLMEERERRRKFAVSARFERPSIVAFAQRLKAQLDLPSYIVHLGYCPDMRQVAGRYYLARCPLHPDHTASFYVWEKPTWHFHCFGCGDSGDCFDFVMKVGSAMGWHDAVEDVARYLNVSIPTTVTIPVIGLTIPTL